LNARIRTKHSRILQAVTVLNLSRIQDSPEVVLSTATIRKTFHIFIRTEQQKIRAMCILIYTFEHALRVWRAESGGEYLELRERK